MVFAACSVAVLSCVTLALTSTVPWRRDTPLLTAAEVALVMLAVAGGAERCHLTESPIFIGQPGYSETVVTEATCLQAAVNAVTEE